MYHLRETTGICCFNRCLTNYSTPPQSVDPLTPAVIASIADVIPLVQAESTGSPSLTTVDQDAPSPSKSQITPKTQSSVIPQDVEEDIHDIEVAHIGNDSLSGVPIPEVTSAQSSSTVSPHTIVPVSIRLQLHEQALFCYYDAFLTSVEPKTYKDALTQSCWIEAMQEELNEFERLETAFLNGNLREEVYVSQSDEFVDQDNPNHVYKLKKALYGLRQAPRAWYDVLSLFLISQDFFKGSVDLTFFIRRNGNDLLLKYGFESCNPVDTPMVEKSKLDEDKEGKAIDPSHYHAFADANHAGCQDTRRSISGSLQFLRDRLISWSSKRSQLTDYGLGFNKIPMYCDNKSVIGLCCNNVQNSRSKHIDIKYHFIKEHVENGVIELYFVNMEYQLADLFTKALGKDRIEFLINKLGMRSFTPETLKQLTDEVVETMDTTIDQQVAMDEALVPHSRRLRIRRSNFRLLSDIYSKDSTLQLVYDVLRLTSFFKAFLVTADVLEIYMQEFWATTIVHHHSIRFKMDNKKHIVNLKSFREILRICPRLPGQTFDEPPFEEEIMAFLRSLGHSGEIRKLTDVEHKDTKKSNEMYYPRFTKVIIHHFMSKDLSIPRQNKVNWHYVRDDQMFTTIKLVSRHQNTQQFGATPPKTKASVQKTKSSFDTTVTPLPTAAADTRLFTSAKGKQPSTTSKAKSLNALSERSSDDGDDDDEQDDDDAQDDDDVQDDDDQEDERNDEDDQEEGSDDEQASDEEEFIHPSLSTHDEEETRDEESFDPIPKTPENTDDEGNRIESIFETTSQIDVQTPTSVAPLPVSTPTLTPLTISTITTTQQAPNPSTTALSTLLQDLPNFGSLFGFDHQLKTLEANFSELMQTNQFVGACDKLRDEAQAENDEFLKTIDENMQKIIKENLYKALVEAYESDKIILDTYGDTVTLKRRHDDDVDKDEKPSVGSEGGPRDEEKERSQSQQALQRRKLPGALASRHKGLNLNKRQQAMTSMLSGESPIEGANVKSSTVLLSTGSLLAIDDDELYKFKEGDFKRLRIQDNEDMLLLLVQGKLTNLIVEERFAFNVSSNVYKKHRNPKACRRPSNCDGTLTDVRTTLDDRLKGIRMKYLPQTIWRKSDKERAAAMIQAIDKKLKTRRIIRSLKRSKSENTGIVPTEMELILEHTQQGISHEVSKIPSIPQRLEEYYHSIKDDILLVSVYTTGNVIVRGMLILDEFLTDDIHVTKEYKEYEKVFSRVDVSTIQPQLVESTQGTNRTPSAHRTPTPTTITGDVVQTSERESELLEKQAHQNHQKEGESYASGFVDSVLQDDTDDSNNRIELGSHMEHPNIIDDDEDNEKEKKDDKNANDDHIDHTLDKTQEMGSLESMNEKMQTPIPSPHRSYRINLS
nr:hypothetical protein [Tanacetum cinerariifolium]